MKIRFLERSCARLSNYNFILKKYNNFLLSSFTVTIGNPDHQVPCENCTIWIPGMPVFRVVTVSWKKNLSFEGGAKRKKCQNLWQKNCGGCIFRPLFGCFTLQICDRKILAVLYFDHRLGALHSKFDWRTRQIAVVYFNHCLGALHSKFFKI